MAYQVTPAPERAYHDLWERLGEVQHVLLETFFAAPKIFQAWKVVPARRIKKLWHDTAMLGFVRDIKGLEMVKDVFIENTLKLVINTQAIGHDQISPSALDDRLTDNASELYADHIWDFAQNCWRISDSALGSLLELAARLQADTSPEDALVTMDRMLNVVHPRSDLASWFVEGGSTTLSEMSGLN